MDWTKFGHIYFLNTETWKETLMPSSSHLIKSGFETLKNFDGNGELEKGLRTLLMHMNSLMEFSEDTTVRRSHLNAIFESDEPGNLDDLTRAYAEILRGADLTAGYAPDVVVVQTNFNDILTWPSGAPYTDGESAMDVKISEAEGGVLAIDLSKPSTKASQAVYDQAVERLAEYIDDYAHEPFAPVVVLTGTQQQVKDFMAQPSWEKRVRTNMRFKVKPSTAHTPQSPASPKPKGLRSYAPILKRRPKPGR